MKMKTNMTPELQNRINKNSVNYFRGTHPEVIAECEHRAMMFEQKQAAAEQQWATIQAKATNFLD